MFNIDSIISELLSLLKSSFVNEFEEMKVQAQNWFEEAKPRLTLITQAALNGADMVFLKSALKNEALILENEVLAMYVAEKSLTQQVLLDFENKFISIVKTDITLLEKPATTSTTKTDVKHENIVEGTTDKTDFVTEETAKGAEAGNINDSKTTIAPAEKP